MIGGILALFGSLALIALGALAFAYSAYNSVADYYSSYYTPTYTGAFGLAWGFLIGIGVWMLIIFNIGHRLCKQT